MSETEPPARPPEATAQPRLAGRRVLPLVLVGVVVLLVIAATAAVIYAMSIDRSVTSNLTRQDNLPAETPTAPGESPRPTKDPEVLGTLDYVLLGSDSRDPTNSGSGRSDTLLIVHLNQKRDKAYIISFPRDMYVTIPGYGKNKINAAFAFGGPKLTVRTLESLLDVRMDHVALVDFAGFIELTESLGGVTVRNENAFKSHGFSYPRGEITIKGEEALWFVRERYSLPRGDLDRAENQRNVIKAIVAKGLSREVVSDPAKFTSFIAGVARHITVDQSLSNSEMRATALSLRLSATDIESLQAPLSGFGTSPDGQSIDIVDQNKLRELARALKKDQMDAYLEKYPED